MPEINVRPEDVLHETSYADLLARYKNIARAYREVNVLTNREYKSIEKMDNVDDIGNIIGPIAQMDNDLLGRFCVAFIDDDTENFNNAPITILARAYIAKQQKGRRRIFGRNSDDAMAVALAKRIDEMSADFANSGGMVLDNGDNKWPLVDINNIANVYESFSMALKARIADLDEKQDAAKIAQMKSNIAQLDAVISDYDKDKGLNKVRAEDASKLDSRWDEIMNILNNVELSSETLEALKKYKFLDENGDVIPQFLENGQLDQEGRAAAILDLLRGDIARRHVVNGKLDKEELSQELNDEFLIELYKIEHIDELKKIVNENPEMFMNAEQREEFMNNLDLVGGAISNDTYNDVLDSNVRATAGWGARLANKLGSVGGKNSGFFDKMFHKNERVDNFANIRMSRKAVDRRQHAIQIIKRILKGFGSALIASVLVMTIASAVAARAGMSVAKAAASIGVAGSLGIMGLQIGRWYRAQRAAGAPTNFKAFLKNKRLLSSLIVTAIAMFAMGAGALGMASASLVLGFIALGLGALKNGAEMYSDVRDADKGIFEALKIARDKFKSGNSMKDAFEAYRKARHAEGSVVKSLALGITNAGSVIAGGITGRALVNVFIDWFNTLFPNNKIFQNVSSHLEKRGFTKEVERSRTVTDWPTNTTHEAAVRSWFGARYPDNPEIMQGLLDAVNQYNADTGSNLEPWAALRSMAMSGGDPNHGVYNAPDWFNSHGYTADQIHAAANALHPDGTYDSYGIKVLENLATKDLTSKGYAGEMPGHTIRSNTDVYQTRGEFPTQHTETWTETQTDYRDVPVTDYNRVDVKNNMAAYGSYNPTTLRDRIGTFWNRVKDNRRDEPKPIEQIEPLDEKHDNSFIPVIVEKTEEKPIVKPVFEDKPMDEVITDEVIVEDTPKTPAPEKIDVNFEDVFTPPVDIDEVEHGPADKEKNPFDLPIVTPVVEQEPVDDLSVVKPVLEDERKSVVNVDDKILALTRPQAQAWHDLNARLKAAKLHAERSKLQYLINNLRNKLGHYDDDTIERAAREALLRDDLNRKAALVAAGPGANASKWDEIDWRGEIAKIDHEIDKKIEKWGAEIERNAMANADELNYPTPVPGIQRQKKDARGYVKLPSENELHPHLYDEVIVEPEIPMEPPMPGANVEHGSTKAERRAAREAEKAKRKDARRKFIASLPQKIERFNLRETLKRAIHREEKNDWPGRTYSVPDSLVYLATGTNWIENQISSVRGVPVHLMDLGGNKTPYTQNRGIPLVVAEIKQDVRHDGILDTNYIRIPFYLATGTENRSSRPTGHWYPLPNLKSDGGFSVDEHYDEEELMDIAADLDAKIGDIRNWSDDELTEQRENRGFEGSVGGSDVLQHVDTDRLMLLVSDSVYNGKGLYNFMGDHILVDMFEDKKDGKKRGWMLDALRNIQAPDWEEQQRAEKKKQRAEKKNERKQNRQEFIGRVSAGIKNISDKLPLKYFDEDDVNER